MRPGEKDDETTIDANPDGIQYLIQCNRVGARSHGRQDRVPEMNEPSPAVGGDVAHDKIWPWDHCDLWYATSARESSGL